MARTRTQIDELPAVQSFEELDQALCTIAGYETELIKAEARLNQEIQKLRETYERSTQELRDKKASLETAVEIFCAENKDAFTRSRSRELVHGTVGYRTNPPKVGFLNKKYNTNTAIELIKRIFKGDYIRQKEEIDKEALLADYATGELTDQSLASVGLKVDQSETFYIDIRWESFENVS